jgi:hypothetical protein
MTIPAAVSSIVGGSGTAAGVTENDPSIAVKATCPEEESDRLVPEPSGLTTTSIIPDEGDTPGMTE